MAIVLAQRTILKSNTSIGTINKSFNSFNVGLKKANLASSAITGTLSTGNIQKKKYISLEMQSFQIRREAVRRREQEDLVESGQMGEVFKRPSKIISGSTQGFLGRVMGFVAAVTVGWIITNLPGIIKSTQALIGRIQSAYSNLSSWLNNTLAFFNDLTANLGGYIGRLTSLSGEIESESTGLNKGNNEIETGVDAMNRSLADGIQKLKNFDLMNELKKVYGKLELPSPGAALQSAGQGLADAVQAGTTALTGGLPSTESPEMYRIAAALSTEGSGKQSTVDMMQVVVNRKASGKYGSSYTDILSAGQSVKVCQFQGVWKRPGGPKEFKKIETLKDASKWSGQSEATLLGIIGNIQDPSLQANAAKFVGGALEFRASPPNNQNGRLSGTAWRGGAGDNQFLKSSKDPSISGPASFSNLPQAIKQTAQGAIRAGEAGMGVLTGTKFAAVSGTSGSVKYGGRERAPLTASYSAFKPGSGAQITSGLGYRRETGTNHKGYDVAAPSGTPLYAYLPGKVTHIGIDGVNSAGYGNWIVWKDSVYGSYHFFGHMLKPSPLRVGSTVDQGTLMGYVGSTGISYGPHLHWEISNSPPAANGQFSAHQDPGAWTRSHPLKGSPATTSPAPSSTPPAQITPPPATTANNVANNITTEKKGQIIPFSVPSASQAAAPPAPTAAGGEGGSAPAPTGMTLNSFISIVLLRELEYT